MSQKIIDLVTAVVAPAIPDPYELVDIEYEKIGSDYILSVLIDKPGGITVEDVLDYLDIPKEADLFGSGEDQMDMKRFDFGIGVGVAYEINKFFVSLDGEFGLTKLVDGDGAPKNMNFSIGVGYKF